MISVLPITHQFSGKVAFPQKTLFLGIFAMIFLFLGVSEIFRDPSQVFPAVFQATEPESH